MKAKLDKHRGAVRVRSYILFPAHFSEQARPPVVVGLFPSRSSGTTPVWLTAGGCFEEPCKAVCSELWPTWAYPLQETNVFYDHFEEEVWSLALKGHLTIADLRDKQSLSDPIRFKNAIVWAASEPFAAERWYAGKGGKQ